MLVVDLPARNSPYAGRVAVDVEHRDVFLLEKEKGEWWVSDGHLPSVSGRPVDAVPEQHAVFMAPTP
jgi:hypothetical protein